MSTDKLKIDRSWIIESLHGLAEWVKQRSKTLEKTKYKNIFLQVKCVSLSGMDHSSFSLFL